MTADEPLPKDSKSTALVDLDNYLKQGPSDRAELIPSDIGAIALSKEETEPARQKLVAARQSILRKQRAAEMEAGKLTYEGKVMPIFVQAYGEKPADGYSLFISMHGGGGAPKRVNDGQWRNQQRLYPLKQEGIYVAPRAPTDTWNLWHQSHIDPLFDRLIENLVALRGVNPNRVYLMGYSAGGDGVYQLAPRMADRFAAAAMMAGHPNETSPLGLRNLPIILQMGGRDAAYKRNQIAGEWKERLAKLREDDGGGYQHLVKIYPNKGHWMDREDAMALPWMRQFTRNPTPKRIVWKQDDVTHDRFYWLGVDEENRKARTLVVASVEGQTVIVDEAEGIKRLRVYLDDRFIDLDQEITIQWNGEPVFQGRVTRTISALWETLQQRNDPALSFPAWVDVDLK